MYTQNDSRNGVVKVFWKDLSTRVRLASPKFADLIDSLSPGNDYPLYLIYLPYGILKGDTESSFLPTMDGKYLKLSDPTLPLEIIRDLGYGKDSSPLGIILENQLEYYMETENKVFSYDVANPGFIFNKSILLNKDSKRNYSPNSVLKATAGSRTAFLLPSISSTNNIIKLSHSLGIKISPPKSLMEHSEVFTKILQSKMIASGLACLSSLFF